jgi:hypothetical protein
VKESVGRGSDLFIVMVRSRGNWSGYSIHVPKWLHLTNDHSIAPYKIEWSSSKWLDLVDQIL